MRTFRFLLSLNLALVPALALPPARAAAPTGDGRASDPFDGTVSPADRVTPEHQEAIDRGVAWLARQQEPSGAFPTSPGDGGNTKSADYKTAVTALATLSFLGAGHGIRHGPYRRHLRLAVSWLLDAQSSEGYISFSGDDQSKMHGHGYATLALAEAYATAAPAEEAGERPRGDEEREVEGLSQRLSAGIERAVRLIERAQSSTRGWGYTPSAGGTTDHEGSVTVCQVQALQAASNRRFKVSMKCMEDARRYMKDSQVANGAFVYRLGDRVESREPQHFSWALAAAGTVSLLGLAEYDRRDALEKAFRFLEDRRNRRGPGSGYWFYGNFYAAQAFHWARGERWERFWLPLREKVLADQQGDGQWAGQDTTLSLGGVYPTAMCLLMLEVPVEYLSIYAR